MKYVHSGAKRCLSAKPTTILRREALKANTLSRELTDLLVDKVLIYQGDHLEICWKLAAFEIDFEYTEDCDYAG